MFRGWLTSVRMPETDDYLSLGKRNNGRNYLCDLYACDNCELSVVYRRYWYKVNHLLLETLVQSGLGSHDN